MAHNDPAKFYRDTYAKLLHFYPKSYRKRFAEPMLQTFSDLCQEYMYSNKNFFDLAVKTYVGTIVEIIKEHTQEVVMSSKAKKVKILVGVSGIIGVIAAIGIFTALNNNPTPSLSSQSISPWSSLAEARERSKGEKAACLTENQAARSAVTEVDEVNTYEGTEFSNFEMSVSEGIMDVPAGTSYDVVVHDYKNKTVTGTLIYDKDYGTYNYTVRKASEPGKWKFESMVACKK